MVMEKKSKKSSMSSAASQLFRMLARNNGAELMIPESNECNDELVAAAHELSKELNIKEVLLKAAMPDLGADDLGLLPSCANANLPWFRPRYRKRKLNETSQGWQFESMDGDGVEVSGEEKTENLGLMDIWMDSEDHAELIRLNDMLTPEIEIVWEGKAKRESTDEKSDKESEKEKDNATVEKQAKRGLRSEKKTVTTPPQTRRSSRNLRSNIRYFSGLPVNSGKTRKR